MHSLLDREVIKKKQKAKWKTEIWDCGKIVKILDKLAKGDLKKKVAFKERPEENE